MCDNYKDDCVFIIGDLNLPHINWQIPLPINNDKYSNVLAECIMSNCLEQLVSFSTRELCIFDLIFCKNFESVPIINTVPQLVNSDHECISFAF